jgi:hypothetical protein
MNETSKAISSASLRHHSSITPVKAVQEGLNRIGSIDFVEQAPVTGRPGQITLPETLQKIQALGFLSQKENHLHDALQ